MLTNNQGAAFARADDKSNRATEENAREPPKGKIEEPLPDWIPLSHAPFRYSSQGLMRSKQQWLENLDAVVRLCVSSASRLFEDPVPQYSLKLREWEAFIRADGMITIFCANSGYILIDCGEKVEVPFEERLVGGNPDEFRNLSPWKQLPQASKTTADWHMSLAMQVVAHFRRDFGKALNNGSAEIMARKNSVFAPFERVTCDQWQYFKLDKLEPDGPAWESQHFESSEPGSTLRWFDPRSCGWGAKQGKPSTATGPTGEKLYAIYVAPGMGQVQSGDLTPENKCTQWLVDAMTAFPERSPKPRAALIQEAMSLFPGLSERGFDRSLLLARQETGITWISKGRRPSRDGSATNPPSGKTA
jgi:hypothetical protein